MGKPDLATPKDIIEHQNKTCEEQERITFTTKGVEAVIHQAPTGMCTHVYLQTHVHTYEAKVCFKLLFVIIYYSCSRH